MNGTVSIDEYRELLKTQANTRGNERTTIDGYTFDSRAEASRYSELVLMEKAGVISNLRVHPTYELQAAFKDGAGGKHRAISYEGDFGYIEDGRAVVEDVKGHRTAVFLLKEKMFRYTHPYIDFRVIEV